MWLYFLEREGEKVVILSNQLLLDATRETQEKLEEFNIRYTLSHPYIEDFEYAEQVWEQGRYKVMDANWLAEALAGWHCEIEEKPEAQPLARYEDIFNKQKKRKSKGNAEEENENPPKTHKPLPHQKWVWNKSHIIEGTIEMIIEEVLRRGLFVEFLTSEFGKEVMHYYGEALRDLVRKKIRELRKFDNGAGQT